MRKVDIVRPPINYAVIQTNGWAQGNQIAWFVYGGDAADFIRSQDPRISYEVVEARR